MKIALVDVTQNHWQTGYYCRHSQLEPIGLEYIGAIIVDAGYDVRIFHQINANNENFLVDIIEFNPDIIGFSTYTYTFKIICNIASTLKRNLPKTVIVVGGHHITAVPEDISNDSIDYGVLGEGDITFLELVQAIENDSPLNQVSGIIYKQNVKIVQTQPRGRIKNLDKLPIPLRNIEILSNSKVRSVIYPPPSKQKSVAQVITSRGCLNNCSYCCSPIMWRRKLVIRTPENIADEFEYLHKEYGTNLIHVSDLSVNLNRDHIIKMCNAIAKRNLEVYWTACGNIDNMDEEIIDSLAKAKCKRMAFGIENLSENTICKIKPNQNNDFSNMTRTLEKLRNNGIFTRGFFIIGFPWETPEDLDNLSENMNLLALDDIRISFITPFPGTRIYGNYNGKGLIQNFDYNDYTSEIPLIENKQIPNSKYLELRETIFRSFYLSKSYSHRMLKQIQKFPEYKMVYEELFDYLQLPVFDQLLRNDTLSKNLLYQISDFNI